MILHGARVGLAGAAVLVVTSGCGVAGTGVQPGAAATVGDATVSSSTVDEYAAYFCDALDDGALGEVGAVPGAELKQGVAGNLTRRLAAEQFAEDLGITPDDYYQQVAAQAEASLTALPDDATDALVEVQSTQAYVDSVALVAGEEALVAEGDPDPGPDAAQERGQALFAEWLADQDVEIDPALGVELDDTGALTPVDGSTSVAASDLAVAAATSPVDEAGQPVPGYSDYVASLPASQRCG